MPKISVTEKDLSWYFRQREEGAATVYIPGIATFGPEGEPVLCNSSNFANTFGTKAVNLEGELSYNMAASFIKSGFNVLFHRVALTGSAQASATQGDETNSVTFTAKYPGTFGNHISLTIRPMGASKSQISIYALIDGTVVETTSCDLADPTNPSYYANLESGYITISVVGDPTQVALGSSAKPLEFFLKGGQDFATGATAEDVRTEVWTSIKTPGFLEALKDPYQYDYDVITSAGWSLYDDGPKVYESDPAAVETPTIGTGVIESVNWSSDWKNIPSDASTLLPTLKGSNIVIPDQSALQELPEATVNEGSGFSGKAPLAVTVKFNEIADIPVDDITTISGYRWDNYVSEENPGNATLNYLGQGKFVFYYDASTVSGTRTITIDYKVGDTTSSVTVSYTFVTSTAPETVGWDFTKLDLVDAALLDLAETRGTSIFLVDGKSSWEDSEMYTYCGLFNSSYAAGYGPWGYAQFTNTGVMTLLPGSYAMITAWAQSCSDGIPIWMAPAGVKRASLGSFYKDTKYFVGKRTLDMWQNHEFVKPGQYSVNPIMIAKQYGYVVYGNSTLLKSSPAGATSMLQSFSVRVLSNIIKIHAFDVALSLQFDQLTGDLFTQFRTLMNTFMDQLRYQEALYDYEILLTNGTLTSADLNERRLPVIIRISPNPSADNFDITLEITQSGVSFSDEADTTETA